MSKEARKKDYEWLIVNLKNMLLKLRSQTKQKCSLVADQILLLPNNSSLLVWKLQCHLLAIISGGNAK